MTLIYGHQEALVSASISNCCDVYLVYLIPAIYCNQEKLINSETCYERPPQWQTNLYWETSFAVTWPYISIHLYLRWKTTCHIRPLSVGWSLVVGFTVVYMLKKGTIMKTCYKNILMLFHVKARKPYANLSHQGSSHNVFLLNISVLFLRQCLTITHLIIAPYLMIAPPLYFRVYS